MRAPKQKTFVSQVNQIACTRLKLKRREKTIFFRLLGFLIRNDKPFPYSIESLSENTGYGRSSVFEALNELERLRLISREGFTSHVRYAKGTIMIRICSLVQNRPNITQIKNYPLVQKLDKTSLTSPETGYKRTYNLEHKERRYSYEYQKYMSKFNSGKQLGLIPQSEKPLSLEEFESCPVD